jgi:hypothetical protein
VQYDSCGITHIRRLPELAAAYDAAVAAVLSCLTALTRLCYSLSGAPVDADLAPLAAAAGLVQLQLQVVWQLEQLLRLKMQQQHQQESGGCGSAYGVIRAKGSVSLAMCSDHQRSQLSLDAS